MWTEENVEKLKKLWDKGYTGGEIVKEFRGIFTRNAVIGKVHRLGLATRMKKKPRKAVIKKAVSSISAVTNNRFNHGPSASQITARMNGKSKPVVEETIAPQSLSFAAAYGVCDAVVNHEGNERCRFPIGNPDEDGFHFCTNHAQHGKPYCMAHCEVAYTSAYSGNWLDERREWAKLNPTKPFAKRILRKLAMRDLA